MGKFAIVVVAVLLGSALMAQVTEQNFRYLLSQMQARAGSSNNGTGRETKQFSGFYKPAGVAPQAQYNSAREPRPQLSLDEMVAQHYPNAGCAVTEDQYYEALKANGYGISDIHAVSRNISHSKQFGLNGVNMIRLDDLPGCQNEAPKTAAQQRLEAMVTAELFAECSPRATLTAQSDAFVYAQDGLATVFFSHFECRWKYNQHPFCGATGFCSKREYRLSRGNYVLVREYLDR